MKPTIQINRGGNVTFSDAAINVWEEGNQGGWSESNAWDAEFKRQVFKRILQQLNRLGWTCKVPEIEASDVEHYGYKISAAAARRKRVCNKGDLYADLDISGRCIDFEMFQNVNAPDRPDHGGRYQSDKEKHMPYVMRLEMERTRRRIRTYLCNVFSDYVFKPDSQSSWRALGPQGVTTLKWLENNYAESSHFKGDLSTYKISDGNAKSADDVILKHGQRVWFTDWHGRICTGTTYYNINNMWWIITGKYSVTNQASFDIYARQPENLRIKRNSRLRRRRLEGLLAEAVKVMDFKRAEVLKNLIFKPEEPLFVLWNEEHQLYHRSGFNGYVRNPADAGKFTTDELKPWRSGGDTQNKILPLPEAV